MLAVKDQGDTSQSSDTLVSPKTPDRRDNEYLPSVHDSNTVGYVGVEVDKGRVDTLVNAVNWSSWNSHEAIEMPGPVNQKRVGDRLRSLDRSVDAR